MDLTTIISIIQIIIAVLLVIAVLMQNRGAGMGAVFGGDSNVYRTKRGAEKFLFWGTIVLAFLFFIFAFLQFFV